MEFKTNKQNILLIMPDFFSTQRDVKRALEDAGYNVFLFSDRPKSKLAKALIRINRKLLSLKMMSEVKKIIKICAGLYFKQIIIIDAQGYLKRHVKKLLEEIRHEDNVFYIWDSIKNYPYTLKIMPLFNHTITFNYEDYNKFNFDYFLPLFIPYDYCTKVNQKENYKFDISFVGTGRPEKYYHLKRIFEKAKQSDMNTFCYLYLPFRPLFYFYKLTSKKFKGAKISEFSFKKLSSENIRLIYSDSKYLLDVGNPTGDGLSLRVFEAIGSNRKLILTNRSISIYDFYNESNFYVWNGSFDSCNEFFNADYVCTNVDKYYIYNWIYYLIEPNRLKKSSFIKETFYKKEVNK